MNQKDKDKWNKKITFVFEVIEKKHQNNTEQRNIDS